MHRQCINYNRTDTHEGLSSESNSTASSLDVSIASKNTTIYIRNNYTSVVEGRETEFLSSMRMQLTSVLDMAENVLMKVKVKPGSILLDTQITSTPDKAAVADRAHGKLASLLANGSLELMDLEGKKLDIPAQKDGQVTEQKDYTPVIIGVTASSLGDTLLLILWILWNNKKRKAMQPSRSNQVSADDIRDHLRNRKETPVPGAEPTDADSHFLALTDPQTQWDLFQQSFNKPGYVWHSQDLWTTTEDKIGWSEFIPEAQTIPQPARYDEPDHESQHI